MTKESYFEMCEMLGQPVVEEDIPAEAGDLPLEAQEAFEIYGFLPDRWDSMNGVYLGKDFGIVFNLFETYQIIDNDTKQLYLRLMSTIDKVRSEIIAQKQKQRENKKPSS